MDVRQCTIITALQFFYRFKIFSKKLEGNTKEKKKKPKEDYYKSEGRIKTAVLRSFHFLYQEETQGQRSDASLISLLKF